MKRNRRILFTVLSLLVCIAIIKLWYSKDQTKKDKDALLKVQTIRVSKSPLPEAVDTVGYLIAVQDIIIRAGVPGRVQTLDALAGGRVEKGQKIVTLLPNAEVRAPFSGYLADWKIKVGEQVTVGTPLIELVNTEKFLVEYRIPEQYAGKLKIGQRILLEASNIAMIEGQVQFVSPLIDKKSYTILLRAEINNTQQTLWPGMSVHIRHVLSENKEALVIPESCLIPTLEGYDIYKVVAGQLIKETVQIGSRLQGRVQLLSGVVENDQVVLVHTPMLRDGVNVQAIDWTGNW